MNIHLSMRMPTRIGSSTYREQAKTAVPDNDLKRFQAVVFHALQSGQLAMGGGFSVSCFCVCGSDYDAKTPDYAVGIALGSILCNY
jgi:hypothetical protein